MSIRATVLRTDGATTTQVFDADPPLEWLQEQVAGYIEFVHGLPHRIVVNEDAALVGLAINQLAAERFGDIVGSVDGFLRGNVIVIEPLQ